MSAVAAFVPTPSLRLVATGALHVSKRTKAAQRRSADAAKAAAAAQKSTEVDKEAAIAGTAPKEMTSKSWHGETSTRRSKRAAAHHKEVELAQSTQEQGFSSASSPISAASAPSSQEQHRPNTKSQPSTEGVSTVGLSLVPDGVGHSTNSTNANPTSSSSKLTAHQSTSEFTPGGPKPGFKLWETVPLRFPPRDVYPPSPPDLATDNLRIAAIALGVASLGARPAWRRGSPVEARRAVEHSLDSSVREGDSAHRSEGYQVEVEEEQQENRSLRDDALKLIDADGYWSSASVHTRPEDESPDWMFEDAKVSGVVRRARRVEGQSWPDSSNASTEVVQSCARIMLMPPAFLGTSQRLEWLGDAVVGLVARNAILTRYPDLGVAGATQAWGHVVSNDTFGHIWNIAGLQSLRLSTAERITSDAVLREKRRLVDVVVNGDDARMEHEIDLEEKKPEWDQERKIPLEDTLDEKSIWEHPAMQSEALGPKFNPVLRPISDNKLTHASKADQ